MFLWRPVSMFKLCEFNLSFAITFLYFGISTMLKYLARLQQTFICLYKDKEVHVKILVCHSVMYTSLRRLFNNGINVSMLTDSGNSHTSAKPEFCNIFRTFEDQLTVLSLYSNSNLCAFTIASIIQLSDLRPYNFNQYLTMRIYLFIYNGNLPSSEYSDRVFVDDLTFKCVNAKMNLLQWIFSYSL